MRRTTPATQRPLATVPELAKHYGVSRKTVYDWIYKQVGIGPLTFRVGGGRRARWEDIEKYDAAKAELSRKQAA